MLPDLKAFRQDLGQFVLPEVRQQYYITFFPTAGPASRTKLGIHVWGTYCGEAPVLTWRPAAHAQLLQTKWRPLSFFVRVVWWVFLPPILIFQAPHTRASGLWSPLGRSGIVRGAMGLCWSFEWWTIRQGEMGHWRTKPACGRGQPANRSWGRWIGTSSTQRKCIVCARVRNVLQKSSWWCVKCGEKARWRPADWPKLPSVPRAPWTWSPCLIWTSLNNHLYCTMSVNLAFFLTRRLNSPFSLLTSVCLQTLICVINFQKTQRWSWLYSRKSGKKRFGVYWRWRRRRNVFCPIFWNKVNFTFASFENLSAIMHVKSKRSFNLLKLICVSARHPPYGAPSVCILFEHFF